MARLKPKEWEAVRLGYEVRGLSFDALSKSFNIHKSNISRKAKKDGWNQKETQQNIELRVTALMDLSRIMKETQPKSPNDAGLIDSEVERRLSLTAFFDDSMLYNQTLANNMLHRADLDGKADLMFCNLHSQVTNRNKEGMLGKPIQTQVNIENNAGVDADRVIARLMEKHGKA